MDEIDLGKGLSVAELEALIGDDDYKLYLNGKNELYRDRKMKDNPPGRREALRLMSENPNLVKRPLFVYGKRVLQGFDEEAVRKLLS
ncbi:MAG: hypothetical protein JJE04_10645 [Acidobacteriia bacterium]|nr:hypothetical protein [Terriglobia bacterium]